MSSDLLQMFVELGNIALGIFKAASSIGAIRSKLRIRLMAVAKLRPLFSTDFPELLAVAY